MDEMAQELCPPTVHYQRLFERHHDPMVILSTGGEVLAYNDAVRTLLALDPHDSDALELTQLGLDAETLSSLDNGDINTRAWEVQLAHRDCVLEARLSYVPAAHSGDGIYLWTGHDVTNRVKLEEARQELVNMVVHDLRVPLGNILNSLDLALTAWRERDVTIPTEQILEIGLRSANRMEQLVNDILDSARLQSDERTLIIVPLDVGEIVLEAVESIAASVERRRQKLDVHIAPDLLPLEGDPDLLGRVLVNLLGNAVKYTQDGGNIRVDVEMDETQFRFMVTDNGLGIAPEYQAHLFELFFRGNVRRIRGAGIGLAFCKLAVKAHGGDIWLESEAGKGSTFTFTIPRCLPEHAPVRQETET